MSRRRGAAAPDQSHGAPCPKQPAPQNRGGPGPLETPGPWKALNPLEPETLRGPGLSGALWSHARFPGPPGTHDLAHLHAPLARIAGSGGVRERPEVLILRALVSLSLSSPTVSQPIPKPRAAVMSIFVDAGRAKDGDGKTGYKRTPRCIADASQMQRCPLAPSEPRAGKSHAPLPAASVATDTIR